MEGLSCSLWPLGVCSGHVAADECMRGVGGGGVGVCCQYTVNTLSPIGTRGGFDQ